MLTSTSLRWLVVAVSGAMLLAVAAACGSETVEVPGETVVVEKEVIKEVEVPGETVVVEKEVVKTVEVPGPERVVVREVPGKSYVTDPSTGKVVTAPEYGGTLTYPYDLVANNTDPYLRGGYSGWIIVTVNEKLGIADWAIDRKVFDFSHNYLPESVWTGALAESWEQPDPLTYVFHIREGVKWHDVPPMNGRELTAKDIEFTYQRLTGNGQVRTSRTD